MKIIPPPRRRYRRRLFWWWDTESFCAAIVLVALMWIWMVGLPIALPHGLADQVHAGAGDLGWHHATHQLQEQH